MHNVYDISMSPFLRKIVQELWHLLKKEKSTMLIILDSKEFKHDPHFQASHVSWMEQLFIQSVLLQPGLEASFAYTRCSSTFIPEKHPLSRQVQLAFLMSQVVRNLHTLQTFEYLSCSVTLWFMLLGKLYILHFIVWRTAQTKSRTTYATQKRSILPLTWSLKTLTFSLAKKGQFLVGWGEQEVSLSVISKGFGIS